MTYDSRHRSPASPSSKLGKSQSPVLNMELSTKRAKNPLITIESQKEQGPLQVLFVSSDEGVIQLPVQRCDLYGKGCVDCCLSRDPYCAWDGSSCTNNFSSNKRRARRQDVRYGDPWSQCQDMRDDPAELKTVYGVEGNSTFLECVSRSPQATIKWINQPSHSQYSKELVAGEENLIHMQRGLLLQRVTSANAGLYLCVAYEHSFSRTLARYELHVIPQNHMSRSQNSRPDGNYAASPRSFKELHLMGVSGLTADEYCEQLWYREKRRQQKLRTLKWKQEAENRKARVRRQNPPYEPLE